MNKEIQICPKCKGKQEKTMCIVCKKCPICNGKPERKMCSECARCPKCHTIMLLYNITYKGGDVGEFDFYCPNCEHSESMKAPYTQQEWEAHHCRCHL